MMQPGGLSIAFGYWPSATSVSAGPISIAPLPHFDETLAAMEAQDGIVGDWIYAPAQQVRDFLSGRVTAHPFPSRIFGLPQTHCLTHLDARSQGHLEFLVWCLSFFIGMRLDTTPAGFVDATPVKSGKLVDFLVLGGLESAIALAETFWIANEATPQRANLIEAAIHALFLAQAPQALQYERFIYSYTALDACFALAENLSPPARKLTHAGRIKWMCELFGMPTPPWALPATRGSSPIAAIRNATMHEALYMGRPLGFALHGVGTNENLPLEMKALVCRFLVALLGASAADYVRGSIHSRQRQGLRI